MNKSVLFNIVVGVAATAFVACSNESADVPVDKVFADSLSARNAVAELYQTGAPSLYAQADDKNGPFLAFEAYRTGMFANEEGAAADYKKCLMITDSLCRLAVEKASLLIREIEHSDAIEPSVRSQMAGEVRFLRAFNSFYIAHTDTNNVRKNFLSAEEDLKAAIEMLPERCYGENDFHATANSARMLLADIYLTMSGNQLYAKRYAEAASLVRTIVGSGTNSLAKNEDMAEKSAYNKLRTDARNPEYLFEFIGRKDVSLSSYSLPSRAKTWSNTGVVSPSNAYEPTKSFLRLYDKGDLRTCDRQFFHTFYKYNRGNKTVVELFEPASWFWYQVGDSIGQHVSIYRYAEALLVCAEAVAMSEGVTDEAVAWLLDVRCRANADLNRPEEERRLKAMSRDAFVEEVWIERYRELPFEMKIWQDVRRTGKLPSALDNDGGVVFRNYNPTK